MLPASRSPERAVARASTASLGVCSSHPPSASAPVPPAAGAHGPGWSPKSRESPRASMPCRRRLCDVPASTLATISAIVGCHPVRKPEAPLGMPGFTSTSAPPRALPAASARDARSAGASRTRDAQSRGSAALLASSVTIFSSGSTTRDSKSAPLLLGVGGVREAAPRARTRPGSTPKQPEPHDEQHRDHRAGGSAAGVGVPSPGLGGSFRTSRCGSASAAMP